MGYQYGDALAQELLADKLTTQRVITVPNPQMEIDGTMLLAFVDATDVIPGLATDVESLGIRWNNHATPDPVMTGVMMPSDLDETKDVVLHILASKTGATLGDAVTFTVTAFFQTVGALHDADADLGGASSAMIGDAAAKTLAELTLTLALADVPAFPCKLTFTIQPTDGLLGTDDVIIHAMWLEYTPKLLTS